MLFLIAPLSVKSRLPRTSSTLWLGCESCNSLFKFHHLVSLLRYKSLSFFGRPVNQSIKKIFDVACLLQGFHKQRMPFILRRLRCVLSFPTSQKMKVVGQHFETSCFLFLVNLLGSRLSDMRSDCRLLPAVIGNSKIVSQLHSCFFAGQTEQPGNKINSISICLASEAMETLVQLHAWVSVIVKGANCHAMTADLDAVHLSRLSGGNIAFYCFKYIQIITSSLK